MEDDYAFLWSEPGWTLRCSRRTDHRMAVVFGGSGATVADVSRLRALVPRLAERGARAAMVYLGATRLELGLVSASEARRVHERAEALGLRVDDVEVPRVGYLPVNERTQMCLLIEDDALSRAVVALAREHGVPVVEEASDR
ncbi:MAG: hypothetical protein AAGH15_01175 [Myxococcota bacterium]